MTRRIRSTLLYGCVLLAALYAPQNVALVLAADGSAPEPSFTARAAPRLPSSEELAFDEPRAPGRNTTLVEWHLEEYGGE